MNRICRFSIALTIAGLAGCVGYGYPGSDYGYPSGNQGYPSGGQAYPDDGYPGTGGYGNNGNSIRCESDSERTRHCNVDTRGGVRISRQLSDSPCIQGRSWGYDNSGVWVSQGCRAEFAAGAGGSYNPGNGPGTGYGQTVRCESQDNHQRRCNVAVGRAVDIVRQLSDTRCVQGQNWGWDRSGVWVTGGCRAEFRIR